MKCWTGAEIHCSKCKSHNLESLEDEDDMGVSYERFKCKDCGAKIAAKARPGKCKECGSRRVGYA